MGKKSKKRQSSFGNAQFKIVFSVFEPNPQSFPIKSAFCFFFKKSPITSTLVMGNQKLFFIFYKSSRSSLVKLKLSFIHARYVYH